jgi:nucleotide-binding universal stress UspA family protein
LDDASASAIRSTTSLFYFEDAEFLLLHVYHSMAQHAQARSLMSSESDEAELADEKIEMRRSLVAFAAQVGLPDAKAIVRASTGPAATDILKAAGETDADLVVVSSSEKGALEAPFTGRASQAVLRESNRDVLVAPGS